MKKSEFYCDEEELKIIFMTFEGIDKEILKL